MTTNRKTGYDHATELEYLRRQIAWSIETFGHPTEGGSTVHGVLAHARKELDEITEDPYDTTEWVDLAMLAIDGLWRSLAHEPDDNARTYARDVLAALRAKLDVNHERTWPDWRTGDPDDAVEHDRNADIPACPTCYTWLATRKGECFTCHGSGLCPWCEAGFATGGPCALHRPDD